MLELARCVSTLRVWSSTDFAVFFTAASVDFGVLTIDPITREEVVEFRGACPELKIPWGRFQAGIGPRLYDNQFLPASDRPEGSPRP